jgi:hypothetical protein
MYLKRVTINLAKQLKVAYPFSSGTWYVKMNEDGTPTNKFTCMDNKELEIALNTGEFSRVE